MLDKRNVARSLAWLYKRTKCVGTRPGESLSPHSIRHTVLTRLCRLGTPITTVAAIAGHKNITTTMRYLHAVEDDGKIAMTKLGGSRR
jgi:integrase